MGCRAVDATSAGDGKGEKWRREQRSRVAAIDDREARVAAFSVLAGWDRERERPRTKARRGRVGAA